MKSNDQAPTDLVRTWQLPYAARLGSSVRSKGIFLEVRARLPKSARKALAVSAGELTLRMAEGLATEFEDAVSIVDKTLTGIEDLPVIPREIEDILSISTTERKEYIFGILFLKRCSDVFDQQRQRILREQRALGRSEKESLQRADHSSSYTRTFFVPPVARWDRLLKDVHINVANELNKALEGLENENHNAVRGVLGHINFARKVGESEIPDERLRRLISHFNKYRSSESGDYRRACEPVDTYRVCGTAKPIHETALTALLPRCTPSPWAGQSSSTNDSS